MHVYAEHKVELNYNYATFR